MPGGTKKLGLAPRLNISITGEVIGSAVRRNSGHCMIADAVRNSAIAAGMLPSAIAVDLQTIRVTDRKTSRRYIYLTPRRGQVALLDFDQGVEQIEPFDLQLRNGQVISTQKPELVTNESGRVKRTGGKAPPRPSSVGTGQRREFGIRAYRR